jgi:hypothetical protein
MNLPPFQVPQQSYSPASPELALLPPFRDLAGQREEPGLDYKACPRRIRPFFTMTLVDIDLTALSVSTLIFFSVHSGLFAVRQSAGQPQEAGVHQRLATESPTSSVPLSCYLRILGAHGSKPLGSPQRFPQMGWADRVFQKFERRAGRWHRFSHPVQTGLVLGALRFWAQRRVDLARSSLVM